jgi:YidC/Oxa1 family membrane protein insertase
MFVWSSFLDLFRIVLFALAHVCGGSLGAGIVALSLIVRIALLPLTLRLAIRARAHQRVLKTLEPELQHLQRRHAGNPVELGRATRALYASHGIGALPEGTLVGALIQMPIGAAVYQTIASIAKRTARFLWVADVSRPDALVASVAAGLAGAAIMAAPSSGSSRAAAGVVGLMTFVLAWRLSAGVGLYWVASNVVGLVQSLLVRRIEGKKVIAA